MGYFNYPGAVSKFYVMALFIIFLNILNLNVIKMSKEQFELKKDVIEAIPEKEVMYPNIPVDAALQEAEDLNVWCQEDKDKLVKAGLEWRLVEDLPAFTGACRYIQSQWQKEYKSLEEAQKEWNLKSPEAYELRNNMIHNFLHAYFKFSDLYSRTQKIAEGNTHADMIQDLSDLAALGKANTQPLQSINFDLALLDKAETMAAEMAQLLANSNGKKLENNKLRILRDKSYTCMKKSVDEIRRNGQFVFWKDEQRNKGYISLYIKKMNMKAQNTKTEKITA
jgi:hypothetical protein